MIKRNLLINTIVAMKKNNMGISELADVIGVESRMLTSWINGGIKLDELNIYKLNWFVFLALVQGLSAKQIVERYNLSSLTLDKDPLDGREHLEPWNSVEDDL